MTWGGETNESCPALVACHVPLPVVELVLWLEVPVDHPLLVHAPLPVVEQVLWLEVPVDHPLLVHVRHGTQDLYTNNYNIASGRCITQVTVPPP